MRANDHRRLGATLRTMLTGATAVAAIGFSGAAWAQAAPAVSPIAVPQQGKPTAADPAWTAPAPLPAPTPFVPRWTMGDAQALLEVIQGVGADGLIPADYEPASLAAAIAGGEGPALNETASRLFTWLAEDLRDGRTPMDSRLQWFAVDHDQDLNPTVTLLARATEKHDVKGVLASLHPVHPDYAALKSSLATVKDDKARKLIRANMDRWRWLNRDLGVQYLITNVPEYMLRLTVNDKIITTYRTVVGKPGRTATPQLAETVEGVIFNPTWTVPQSIVKGEGLGARLLANPARAKAEGYTVTKGADGYVQVVQQPGKGNSLGLMKLDMPNPHAIFVHDTPARGLFNQADRALSHGCIRAERASELAMTMAILGAGITPEEGVQHTLSGKYTKVAFTKTFPIYITYFTMARDVEGRLRSFADIYGRDKAVLASFEKPRQIKTGQRTTSEPVVAIEDPGV